MSPPKIFIDLDETLIHTIGHQGSRRRTYLRLAETSAAHGRKRTGIYGAVLRPGAADTLAGLRAAGELHLMTFATREYALGFNDAFSLGFTGDFIHAREDFTFKILADEYAPIATEQFPGAILIDNEGLGSSRTRLKLAFLGRDSRLIKAKAFYGHRDALPLKIMIDDAAILSHEIFAKRYSTISPPS